MIDAIRLIKWCLLVVGLCWALYSSYGLILLAHAFPSSNSNNSVAVEILASLQGYLVVFGPFFAALALLMIKWPKTKS